MSFISTNIGGMPLNNNNGNSNVIDIEKLDRIFVNQQGDKLLGNLDLNFNKIINLKEPTEDLDIVTKKYVDDNLKFPKIWI